MTMHEKVTGLKQNLQESILGQERLVDRLLMALFADGHLLVEGAPGLAKTKSIKSLSYLIEGNFQRMQFTPDLLPADLTGTDIFSAEERSFSFQPGPIFHNLILADEINRAPAKVQSALLEAMGERQVSVGKNTYKLPELFLVMATQNPIEQEGTFSLPEAQLDRFMMHVKVDYPDKESEKKILSLNKKELLSANIERDENNFSLSQKEIFSIRKEINELHIDPSIIDYIIEIIFSTRTQEHPTKLNELIDYGASPRASIFLERCARVHAWLKGKDFVAPSDIQEICHEVLRHRIGLTFEAESQRFTSDKIIDEILSNTPLP